LVLVTALVSSGRGQGDLFGAAPPNPDFFGADPAAAGNVAELPLPLRMNAERLRQDHQALENQKLGRVIAAMDEELVRMGIGTKWLGREAQSHGSYCLFLMIDERVARQLRDRLQKQRNELLNAGDRQFDGRALAAVKRSLGSGNVSDELAYLVQGRLPALAAKEFTAASALAGLIAPDGAIARPPVASGADDDAQQQTAAALVAAWNVCWGEVATGQDAAPQTVAAVRRALKAYEETWSEQDRDALACLHRSRAKRYVADAAALLQLLDKPGQGERLYRGRSATGFAGGTVGEFVAWLSAEGAAPRLGTPGQVVLGEVVRLLVEEKNQQIAAVETRIEKLKTQNPQHNAVLRSRMTANPEASLIKAFSGSGGVGFPAAPFGDTGFPAGGAAPPVGQPSPPTASTESAGGGLTERTAYAAALHRRLPFLAPPAQEAGPANPAAMVAGVAPP
jgi:hypothetical protein